MPAPTRSAASITLEVGPSFAAEDAARLHDALVRAAPGAQVEIDFHRVRDYEAVALAALARDLASRGHGVALRGMSQRQLRILGYLGYAEIRAED
ncbi:MAG TPA: STAS domain-containing protein [Anaeromyxobacter sp.]